MEHRGPIEDRLRAVEDRQAIEELKHRYWRACDGKDPVAMRGCFVSRGAEIDLGPLGRTDADGLVEIFERIALERHDGGYRILDMHHGMHPVIDVRSATEATGSWTLRFRQLDLVARTERVAAIEYDDEYRVEDGGWRIARSRARELWAMARPLPDDVTITERMDG